MCVNTSSSVTAIEIECGWKSSERTFLWVPLSHSAYKETKIGEYQAAAGCDPDNPISSLPEHEQDRVFDAICEEIKELIYA